MDIDQELLNDFVQMYEKKLGIRPGVLLIVIHPDSAEGAFVTALSNYQNPDPRDIARKFAEDMIEDQRTIN